MKAWPAAQQTANFSISIQIQIKWQLQSLHLFKSTPLSGSLIPRLQTAQNAIELSTGGSEDTIAEFVARFSVVIALKTVKSLLMQRSRESGSVVNANSCTRSFIQK